MGKSDVKSNTSGLPMKEVVRLTGTSEFLLRAWELRYRCITPSKTPTGRRLYSSQEIEKIKLLHSLTQLGTPIRKLANLHVNELRELLASQNAEASSSPEVTSFTDACIRLLKEFDLDGLKLQLGKEFKSNSPSDFLMNTISPLMREVGHLVHDGKLSIFQEHAFSAYVRTLIGQVLIQKFPKAKKPLKIVLATPEMNLHEFGILIAAGICNIQGHHVTYLGPHLPVHEMTLACKKISANVLILSTVENPTKMIELLDSELPSKTQIWLGGSFTSAYKPKKRPYHYIPSFSELLLRLKEA